jgi:hypothetical protein
VNQVASLIPFEVLNADMPFRNRASRDAASREWGSSTHSRTLGSEMSMTFRVTVALLALVAIAGCRATGGDVPVVVRNLSPEAITFVTEEPGPFLFSNTGSHTIQPWKKGDCYARLGLIRGHIKLTVSGSNVPAPVTYETTPSANSAVAPAISVQIDADGRVQFGVTIPEDDQPCVDGGY